MTKVKRTHNWTRFETRREAALSHSVVSKRKIPGFRKAGGRRVLPWVGEWNSRKAGGQESETVGSRCSPPQSARWIENYAHRYRQASLAREVYAHAAVFLPQNSPDTCRRRRQMRRQTNTDVKHLLQHSSAIAISSTGGSDAGDRIACNQVRS
ncbi:hypothetical protein BJV78DRAFT_85995 [Lactifluus subvellereus]|nr:hypothetical protein BJV78DRAFT_85995 [Lactifluus subvellereus]